MTLTAQQPRNVVRGLAAGISPHDDIERDAQQFTLDWIDSGAPLFRVQPPNVPDPHLCVYAVLFDADRRKVLLADHVKARCWLPPGGHVDPPGESPRDAVLREAREELAITPAFHPCLGDAAADPFFMTVTRTRGDHSHTDVSLWWLLDGHEGMTLLRDPAEAHELRWIAIDDAQAWVDPSRYDPGMLRFNDKLRTVARS